MLSGACRNGLAAASAATRVAGSRPACAEGLHRSPRVEPTSRSVHHRCGKVRVVGELSRALARDTELTRNLGDANQVQI